MTPREARVTRATAETRLTCEVRLEGQGKADISTGIGFLDHMLHQLARHSLIDIRLQGEGDLHIDAHHTTEDCGLVLGSALSQALGARAQIWRYGWALVPMDETLTQVAIDLSNRPYAVVHLPFTQPRLGAMDTELFAEFFKALAQTLGAALHIRVLYGVNNHHMAESAFKGLARALGQAVGINPQAPASGVPSTKEAL